MSNYKRYFNASQNPVFITFVTLNRKNILEQNIDILKESFKYAKNKFKFDIIAISVLKNHCHLILLTDKIEEIPKIIRTIKFNFSINISSEYISNDLSLSAIK